MTLDEFSSLLSSAVSDVSIVKRADLNRLADLFDVTPHTIQAIYLYYLFNGYQLPMLLIDSELVN